MWPGTTHAGQPGPKKIGSCIVLRDELCASTAVSQRTCTVILRAALLCVCGVHAGQQQNPPAGGADEGENRPPASESSIKRAPGASCSCTQRCLSLPFPEPGRNARAREARTLHMHPSHACHAGSVCRIVHAGQKRRRGGRLRTPTAKVQPANKLFGAIRFHSHVFLNEGSAWSCALHCMQVDRDKL